MPSALRYITALLAHTFLFYFILVKKTVTGCKYITSFAVDSLYRSTKSGCAVPRRKESKRKHFTFRRERTAAFVAFRVIWWFM
jgi:hypothetical protein